MSQPITSPHSAATRYWSKRRVGLGTVVDPAGGELVEVLGEQVALVGPTDLGSSAVTSR